MLQVKFSKFNANQSQLPVYKVSFVKKVDNSTRTYYCSGIITNADSTVNLITISGMVKCIVLIDVMLFAVELTTVQAANINLFEVTGKVRW